MKKVALITKNKILAQSLAAAMRAMPDFDFDVFMFLDAQQALTDAEIFEIDVAFPLVWILRKIYICRINNL